MFGSRNNEDKMDGFMDIGHQKGEQRRRRRGRGRWEKRRAGRGGWDATLSGILLYWTLGKGSFEFFNSCMNNIDYYWGRQINFPIYVYRIEKKYILKILTDDFLTERCAPASDQWHPSLSPSRNLDPGLSHFTVALLWAAVNSSVTKHNVLTRHNIGHYMETRVATSWSSNQRENKNGMKICTLLQFALAAKNKEMENVWVHWTFYDWQ